MKELTKAEEQIMQELWTLGKAFVKDILDRLPDPKPAYNTVSTIIRILEKKGFIDHYIQGKNHQYFPVISKTEYTKLYFRNFLSGYFNNSFQEMVSFKENKMTLSDLDEIIEEVGKDLQSDNTPSNEVKN
jgi:BlaI family transcriptional regulator, penicillinase repressor